MEREGSGLVDAATELLEEQKIEKVTTVTNEKNTKRKKSFIFIKTQIPDIIPP